MVSTGILKYRKRVAVRNRSKIRKTITAKNNNVINFNRNEMAVAA